MNGLGTDLAQIAAAAKPPLPGDKPAGTIPMAHGFITLRDPEKIPEKARRPAKRALIALQPHLPAIRALNDEDDAEKVLPVEVWDASNDFADALAVCMIESWSYDGDVTVERLLDTVDYDEIIKTTSPFTDDVFPNFEVSPDPKATTGG